MLTPTEVHYVVGLLELVAESRTIDVELGAMIADVAADEERDVDVTVAYRGADGRRSVLRAIEVKHHRRPLDVTHVEQLSAKLGDMPSIGMRAIVSSSGYTEGAIAKAKAHGVELLALEPWTPEERGFAIDMSAMTRFGERGVVWKQARVEYFVDPPMSAGHELTEECTILAAGGAPAPSVPTVGDLTRRIAQLVGEDLTKALGPLPDGETLDVDKTIDLPDGPIIVLAGGSRHDVHSARVTGELRYIDLQRPLDLRLLRRVSDRVPIIGCGLAELSSGDLVGLTVTLATRTLSLIRVRHDQRAVRPIRHRLSVSR